MRGRIIEVDTDHDAYVHEVDRDQIQIVADHCQAMRSAGQVGSKDDRLAMTCDGFTIMQWCDNNGIEWGRFWRDQDIQTRFLNDPANKAFRIWEGRV